MDDLLGSAGEDNDEERADFEDDEQPPLPAPEDPATNSSAADAGDGVPAATQERRDPQPTDDGPRSGTRGEDKARHGREEDRARDR